MLYKFDIEMVNRISDYRNPGLRSDNRSIYSG